MKAVLVIAAVLSFSASAALAECAGHKVNAAVEVDRDIKTASITSPVEHSADSQSVLIKKSDRLPDEVPAVE